MDGFVNIGFVYCCYGGNILLDWRMGFWYFIIFLIYNVFYYWIWWCCFLKRGSKFCFFFIVWILSFNCVKLVFFLWWFFFKGKCVRFKIKFGIVLFIFIRFFLCDSSFLIELMNYFGKNLFYCFFCD